MQIHDFARRLAADHGRGYVDEPHPAQQVGGGGVEHDPIPTERIGETAELDESVIIDRLTGAAGERGVSEGRLRSAPDRAARR